MAVTKALLVDTLDMVSTRLSCVPAFASHTLARKPLPVVRSPVASRLPVRSHSPPLQLLTFCGGHATAGHQLA